MIDTVSVIGSKGCQSSLSISREVFKRHTRLSASSQAFLSSVRLALFTLTVSLLSGAIVISRGDFGLSVDDGETEDLEATTSADFCLEIVRGMVGRNEGEGVGEKLGGGLVWWIVVRVKGA